MWLSITGRSGSACVSWPQGKSVGSISEPKSETEVKLHKKLNAFALFCAGSALPFAAQAQQPAPLSQPQAQPAPVAGVPMQQPQAAPAEPAPLPPPKGVTDVSGRWGRSAGSAHRRTQTAS